MHLLHLGAYGYPLQDAFLNDRLFPEVVLIKSDLVVEHEQILVAEELIDLLL